MSSSVLRRAIFEDSPLIIDNAFEIELPPAPEPEAALASDLVEELQQEHPDAEPELIEDAVNDAIDQILNDDQFDLELETAQIVDLGADADQEEEEDLLAASPSQPAVPEAIVTPPPPPAVDTERVLAEARQAAEDIGSRARAEAQQVLAEADGRAAEIERAAYEKGYGEGLAAGKSGGEDQSVHMVKQITAIVDEATKLHDTMLHEAESEMVALCLEVARKIIQAELRTNPDVVKSVVAAAVKKINGSPRVTIKVNPSQLDSVRQHWLAAYGPNYRETEWIIEGDSSITAGGCVLQSKYGTLDAQIGSQFAEIQKTFALLLGN